jgi:acyl-coenzyme A synthetase/AMP-(fatty) acid ligase
MNITDRIGAHARARPGAAAIIDGDRVLRFAELEAALRFTCDLLSKQGIGPGDVVGLPVDDSLAHLLLTLSLARCGAASLHMHPEYPANNPASKRKALADHFGVTAVVSDRKEAGIDGCRLVLVDIAPAFGVPVSRVAQASSVSADDLPWRICLTSGTTGIPKGVAQYHARFDRISVLRARAMGLDTDSRLLCRMGIVNTPVLIRAVTQLSAGGAVVFQDGDLRDLFDAIERHRVTHAFVSPVMLRRWLDVYPLDRPPLSGLRHLAVGGGRLSVELGRAAMTRLTPHLFTSYGSTESGAIARGDPETLLREPESVGRVVPWAEVQVVDDLDRPLPHGEMGTMRIRGEEVATGYFGGHTEASGTAKGFRDGWFYPGDLCRLTADGLLFVEDRADDVINLGGPKINVRAIEDALAAHPAVQDVAVFAATARNGTRVLCAAVVPRGDFSERSLRQYLRDRGLRDRMRILSTRELPRNAAGKILKRELANWLVIRPPGQAADVGEEPA